jgi:hypothetical protein
MEWSLKISNSTRLHFCNGVEFKNFKLHPVTFCNGVEFKKFQTPPSYFFNFENFWRSCGRNFPNFLAQLRLKFSEFSKIFGAVAAEIFRE